MFIEHIGFETCPRRIYKMRIRFALIIIAVAILACSSATPKLFTANDYMEEYGGNPNVYADILSMNDCANLQIQFDLADKNNEREEPGTPARRWTLGYMTAANNRMEEIGCYNK